MVAVDRVDAGIEQLVHDVVELHVPPEGQPVAGPGHPPYAESACGSVFNLFTSSLFNACT